MKKKVVLSSIILLVVFIIGGIQLILNKKDRTIEIKSAEVTQGDIKAYLATSGVIYSENDKNYFGSQGKVKEVKVKVGDIVKNGDILVTYETQDLSASIKQAQIQYDNAVLALQEINSQKALNDKKISELDKQINTLSKSSDVNDMINLQLAKQSKAAIIPISKEKITQAENNVSLAKLALETAESNLSKLKESISSDMDGVVTKVNVAEESMDSGMQPAVVIQDLKNLKIVTKINKYDVNKIQLGQDVNIKANDKMCKGRVSFISPVANIDSPQLAGTDVSLDAEIQVLEGSEELKIGFDTDIDILTNSIDGVVKIPTESIKSEKDGSTYVYVVKNEKAVRKNVSLGIQSDKECEVKSGVILGEKVILNPTDLVKDGTEVKS